MAILALLVPVGPVTADGALINGDSPTDSIDSDGDIDNWTFSASSGDAIRVQIGVSFSVDFSPLIRLYDPGDVLVASGTGALSASLQHNATSSGGYRIEVLDTDPTPAGTGTYTLYLGVIPGGFIVPAGDEGGALTNGGVHTGSIDLGDLDLWTFQADAQDTLRVQIGEVTGSDFNPQIILYDPNGNQTVFGVGADSATLVHTATLGGTYTVVVRDGNTDVTGTGDYRLYFANIPGNYTVPAGDEGGALTNGGVHTGSIDLGDLDMWTFHASEQDTLRVQIGEVTGTGFDPQIVLYDPDGNQAEFGTGTASATLVHTATLGGTYTVVVRDSNQDATGAGDYRLYFANIPGNYTVPAGDEGGALTNGGVHTGSIDLGDLDMWTFHASEQDTLRVQIGEVTGTGFSPQIVLYDPDGNQVVSGLGVDSSTLVHTATLGGTHTVVVRDSNTDATGTGDYRLYFANAPGSYTVPAGDEGGVMTSGGVYSGTIDLGDMDVWTFQADALDTYSLSLTNTGGTGFTPNIRLYDPNGAQVGSASDTVTALLSGPLTTGGIYTVVVRDNSVDVTGTGSYDLNYVLTPDATSVPAGPILATLLNGGRYSGNFATPDKFHLAVNAGEWVRLRLGDLTGTGAVDPEIEVYAGDGSLIAENYHEDIAQVAFRAEATDTLSVVVYDLTPNTGTYDLHAAVSSQPFITPAGDEGGALVNGMVAGGSLSIADIDMYSLAVNAGDTVRLQVADLNESGSVDPTLQVFTADGSLVDTATANANQNFTQVVFTAEANETLTVVLYDIDPNGTVSTYNLYTAITPQAFSIPGGDEGGILANGTITGGSLGIGDIDLYSLPVDAGDRVRLQLGDLTGSGLVEPLLQVFSADGSLIVTHTAQDAARVAFTSEASETCTVVVSDADVLGTTSSYELFTAVAPQAFSTSAGDEGGVLADGVAANGNWPLADIDLYTFSVLAGADVDITLTDLSGSGQVDPVLQVISSDGTLIGTHSTAEISQVVFTAESTDSLFARVYNSDVAAGNYRLVANGITSLDSDTDGLDDALELIIGTYRTDADTDDDGVNDLDEVNYDGDASSYDPVNDLNPLVADTDGDGVDDGTELANGTDPLDPGDFVIPGDINLDGLVNLGDYLKLIQFVLGTGALPSTLAIAAGDLNGNNLLDTGDIVLYPKVYLGFM